MHGDCIIIIIIIIIIIDAHASNVLKLVFGTMKEYCLKK